jgi:hypothetical protein
LGSAVARLNDDRTHGNYLYPSALTVAMAGLLTLYTLAAVRFAFVPLA